MTTTPTSGAADLLAMVSKALREAYNLGQRYWQQADSEYISQHKKADDTRAKFLALVEETCAALAAGQATAVQGVAYAALPEPYCNAHDDADACYPDMFSEHQMRAFADATHALRASRGQAPAGATLYQIMAAAKELHAINRPTGEPEWDALRQCEIDALRRRAERILKAAAPAAPATQQVGEVRRAELVPGVMHCAKCKFQLNRVTLCVSDGNAYAGNNKTEPCPNGCGPLWPVTWEQEAKNCWKALEEMHERLMAAAAPQPSYTAQAADSVTAPAPPPECETEAEKRAFAFGWFKALESERMKADNKKKDPL